MKVILKKTLAGLIPGDEQSSEWFNKLKIGQAVHGDFRRLRNPKFHAKYFALLNIGYDHWEAPNIGEQGAVKNFDRFRKDVTILAGYYHTTIRLDGSIRIEADSISFASMDEKTFEKLYSATIDVFLKHIYGKNWSREEIDKAVEEYLRFI